MGRKSRDKDRKPRTEYIYARTSGEVSEVRFTVDQRTGAISFGPGMTNVYSERSYERPKGAKVLSRIPQTAAHATFDDGDALFLSLVREHWTLDDVTDGEHARDVSLKRVGFDDHLTEFVGLHADVFETETVGERTTTGGDENDVGVHLRLITAGGRFESQSHPTLGLLHRLGDLGGELKVETLLFEGALKRRANLVVDPCAANFIRKFHHGDFRPQSAPHAAKFESDDPASDNNHGFRNLFQFQRPRARDDGFLIRLHPRQRARHRPSRQHHILRLNHLRASVLHRHVHFVRAQELPPPFRVAGKPQPGPHGIVPRRSGKRDLRTTRIHARRSRTHPESGTRNQASSPHRMRSDNGPNCHKLFSGQKLGFGTPYFPVSSGKSPPFLPRSGKQIPATASSKSSKPSIISISILT